MDEDFGNGAVVFILLDSQASCIIVPVQILSVELWFSLVQVIRSVVMGIPVN